MRLIVDRRSPALLRQVEALVGYPADALIVAAAWTASVDYFVTLDRQHLLENVALQARPTVTFNSTAH